MPITVFHSLTATTPDNTSYEIRPQAHWNAPHIVSLSLSGSDVIGAFSNSNGVSFGTAPSGAVTASVSASSLVFANSNGVSFGVNAGTVTASVSSATNALTNINVSAGTTSTNASNLVFSNANSMSFGLAGNTLTGSFNASSLSFSNANNVSFGINGATLTASASFPAATSVTYSNSNNVTFGVAAGVVTASASQSLQTNFPQAVSLGGNVSGVQTIVSSGTLVLAGGNNITLSQVGNGVTISGPSTSAQQTGISGISAGAGVVSSGTIIFSNANGVTFGVAGNTLTASISNIGGAQTGISGIAVAGTNFTSGTVTFSNSNGISFGSAGAGVITASYTVPTQSNDTAAIYASSNTLGQAFSSTYDIRSLTMVGSGEISIGWSNGSLLISTPIGNFDSMGVSNLGNTAGTTGLLSQSVVLAGGNNITLSQATGANGVGTITISGPNAQTAISGVVAGTQTLSAGTVSFANSNGISFGLSNSSITASYSVPSTAGLISAINVSAGTTQSNFSNLVFSNSNAVSFGINGNVITASIPSIAGAQTGISGIAVSNTTFTSGSVTFSNANGVSFGGGGAGVITMSYTVPIISNLLSNIVISAGTASTVLSAFTFSNSNNVSFGYSAGSITASASFADSQTAISGIIAGNTTFTSGTISLVNANGISFGSSGANGISASYTVPTQSAQPVAVSGSNGSFAFSTLSMGNANGISFYTTNGSIVASYTVPGAVGGVGISAGTQSVSTGTVAFSNSNGISFGMSGSNVITASYTVPTQSAQPVAVSGSNGSFAFSTLSMGNSNGLSFYTTNGSIVGSYTTPTVTTNGLLSALNVSAGTTQTNLSNLVFSNANSMSFGLNGSTITGSFSQSIQTQGQDYITIGGNTSGAGALISSGTLFLAGGNNITLSQNGNSLTLSGANVGGAQTGISGVIAGSQTQTSGTLSFANSNGVSFGMSNSSVITASFSTAPQTVQSIGIYASGNTTLTSSGTVDARTLAFSGSGLITVGYSNGTVIIGDSGSQSNQTLGFTAVGNQTLSTTGTFDARSMYVSGAGNITAGFSNSSIIVSGSQTPMLVGFNTLGNDTGATGFVSNQVQLVGGNNITLSGSLNANSMTITISGGGGIGAAAGTQTQLSGTLSFSNANGISFGLNGSSILTASYTVPTQSTQPVGISDSNGYTSFGTLQLGNINGMTLYGSNSSLVGSYTTAPNPVISAGTQVGNSTGTILFGNANGISFGMSNSSVITASYAQSLQPGYIYAQSITTGQSSSSSYGSSLSIVGAGNISVGWSNSSFVISGGGTAAAGNLGIYAVGANTTGVTSSTYPGSSLPIVGAGIISVGNSGGSLYISAPNTTSINLLSAGMTSLGNTTGANGVASAQLILVGGNNVTLSGSFNTLGYGTITMNAAAGGSGGASSVGAYAIGNTTQNTSATLPLSALSFNGLGAMSVGISSGSIQLSAPALSSLIGFGLISVSTTGSTISIINSGPTFSAGTAAALASNIVFSNSNNVSFGLVNGTGGVTITASASGGGGGGGGNFSAGVSGGNTSGTTGVNGTQVVFAGGNNITLSQVTNTAGATITISGANAGGAQTGISQIIAGTQTLTAGTLSFANSNGISFGLSNSSILTASYTSPSTAGLISAINLSAGTTSSSATNFVFSNQNNVSFGLQGNTISASVLAQSVQTQGQQGVSLSGNTSGALALVTSGTLILAGGNNITLSQNGQSVTISAANAGGAQTGISGFQVINTTYTSGTITLQNANGISFGSSGANGISASYTVPSTAGLISAVNVSAGTTSGNISAVVLGNSNGMSFGLNGSTITGSYTVPSTAGLISAVNVSAGTTSNNLSAAVYSNSNNVSFGLNGSTITASASFAQTNQTQASGNIAGSGFTSAGANISLSGTLSTNGLSLSASVAAQSVQPVAVSGSNGSFAFSTLTMGNLNGLSHYTSNGSLVASYTVPSTAGLVSAINLSAGTTSTNASAFTFSNSNGVSFGINGGTITASVAAGGGAFSAGVSGGNTSGNTGATGTQVVFAGGNNITLSQSTNANGATITISGANIGGAQTGISGIFAGTQTQSSGTLSFANSNGISFGLSNSSILTASYTVPSIAGLVSAINLSAGTTSTNASAFTFSNSNGMSFGLNGQTITGSYTVPSTAGLLSAVNVSAGTTSGNLSAFVLSNSNGMSFGLNGSTITGSYTVPTQSVQTQASGAIAGTGFTSAGANISLSGTLGTNGLSLSASVAAQTVQTQNLIDVSLSGNTAGALALVSSGTLIFAGGNNITLSQNGQSITISGANVGGAQTGISGLVVSNTTYTSGTVTFQNANGISFGSSGANGISASYTVPSTAGLLSGINFSAGTTTTNGSGFTFSNSNNVSFGLNAGTVTASASFAQSTQTQASGAIAGTGFTSAGANVSLSGTLATNGLSLSASVAAQSAQPVAVSGSNGSFAFSTLTMGNLNGLTHYTSNGSLVASYTVPSTAGLLSAINASAGTTSNNLSAVVYSNSNNVSFGLNGSTITASASFAQTVQTQNLVDVSLSGNTAGALALVSSGTLILAGGNNITLSQNGQSITISGPNVGGAQTGISGIVVSNTTYTSGTVTFQNANGVSFGSSGANGISASYTVPSTAGLISAVNFSAGTTSGNIASVVYSNSNNVSFGLNGSTITASASFAQTNQTQASGNIAGTGFTSAGANVSLSGTLNTAGLSLSASVAAAATTAAYYLQGNTTGQSSSSTANDQTLSISAAGIISGGWSAGTLVLSATAPSTAGLLSAVNLSAGTTSGNVSNWVYSNSNGVSFGLNGSTITASIQPNVILSAGTTNAVNSGTVVFSNSNGVSFGINGQTLTASVAAASDNFNIVSMGTSTFGGATGGATFSASNGTIGLYAGSNITISQTSNSIIFYGTSGGGGGGGATSGSFFAAGNTTNNSSTTLALTSQVFQGAGGVSVGYSNGSIQVSAPAVSTITGIGLVSISTNGSTISVSGIGPIISAGTTSSNLSNIVFSNSNGISFGLNGGTITASAGAAQLLSYYEPRIRGQVATIALGQPGMVFEPFVVEDALSVYRLQMLGSVSTQSGSTVTLSASVSAGNASSGTGSGGTSGTVVLFSRQITGTNASSSNLVSFYSNTYSMSLGESVSVSWSTNASSATASYTRSGAFGYIANINSTGGVTTSSNTTSNSGSFSSTSTNANSFSAQVTLTFGSLMMSNMRPIIMPFATSLNPGEYWLGHIQSTTANSTNISRLDRVANLPYGIVYFTTVNQGYIELGQTQSNATSNIQQGWGSITNTANTTTTIGMSQISGGAAQSPQRLWFNMMAATK